MKSGMKVVCIDTFKDNEVGIIFPVKGEIYTIREVLWEYASVRLEEIHNNPSDYPEGFMECAFVIQKFRPVVDIGDKVGKYIESLNEVLA